MMSPTHIAFSVGITSLVLGTAHPVALLAAALASMLPDVDTSKSIAGRYLSPVSRWLEKRYAHRTVTHSFLASGIFTLATYPTVLLWGTEVWQALVLGYFTGWFADVFTKTGVAAFYPSPARLVIPMNPRYRLSTGSRAESFLLAILVALAIASISINSSGGILRSFNQALGIPSGAVEIANAEVSQYLLNATIIGRAAVTQQPVNAEFEVVKPLTQSDLLIKDKQGRLYRAGTTQECQIIASRILIQRGQRIRSTFRKIQLQDQAITEVLTEIPPGRTYINGTLNLQDAEDLIIPTHADQFDTITLQPSRDLMVARLESASPVEAENLLGDYYANGSIIIRTVEVL